MKQTVQEWIDNAMRSGAVCTDYMRKWEAATTKAEKFRVICDVNGGEWLFDLDRKGVQLPVGPFIEEYLNFINGKHIVEYPDGYSSKMYCRYTGIKDIVADTTIVYLLDCQDIYVNVPENSFPQVYLSKSSRDVRLHVGEGARLDLTVYGGASYHLDGDTSKVNIERR